MFCLSKPELNGQLKTKSQNYKVGKKAVHGKKTCYLFNKIKFRSSIGKIRISMLIGNPGPQASPCIPLIIGLPPYYPRLGGRMVALKLSSSLE